MCIVHCAFACGGVGSSHLLEETFCESCSYTQTNIRSNKHRKWQTSEAFSFDSWPTVLLSNDACTSVQLTTVNVTLLSQIFFRWLFISIVTSLHGYIYQSTLLQPFFYFNSYRNITVLHHYITSHNIIAKGFYFYGYGYITSTQNYLQLTLLQQFFYFNGYITSSLHYFTYHNATVVILQNYCTTKATLIHKNAHTSQVTGKDVWG